ncbi:hypothetical protein M3Y99_01540100 [Aphelenchoides fujianensis]|nr:hypothetical protein M3Y99_01540100 [Aphelenchoides fujianensis]
MKRFVVFALIVGLTAHALENAPPAAVPKPGEQKPKEPKAPKEPEDHRVKRQQPGGSHSSEQQHQQQLPQGAPALPQVGGQPQVPQQGIPSAQGGQQPGAPQVGGVGGLPPLGNPQAVVGGQQAGGQVGGQPADGQKHGGRFRRHNSQSGGDSQSLDQSSQLNEQPELPHDGQPLPPFGQPAGQDDAHRDQFGGQPDWNAANPLDAQRNKRNPEDEQRNQQQLQQQGFGGIPGQPFGQQPQFPGQQPGALPNGQVNPAAPFGGLQFGGQIGGQPGAFGQPNGQFGAQPNGLPGQQPFGQL